MDGDVETVCDFRYNEKGELEVQLAPFRPFWNIWFFDVLPDDGNDILKDLVK